MPRLSIAVTSCLLPFLAMSGCAPESSGRTELLGSQSPPADVQAKAVDPNTNLDRSITSLHYAAGNDPDVVAALLRNGAQVDARDDRGFTPLRWAAGSCTDPKVFYLLIEAGANLNATNDSRRTPLFSAAFSNRNPEIVELLIRAGADVNARDKDGDTPLSTAARFTVNPEIVSVLIAEGARIDDRSNSGDTALMQAVGYARSAPEVVSLLIEAGADVNARNNRGSTALDIAMSIRNRDNSEKIELLRAAGAKSGREQP